jgi:hypothetical protein
MRMLLNFSPPSPAGLLFHRSRPLWFSQGRLTKPFSGRGQHGLCRHDATRCTEVHGKEHKNSIFSVMPVQSVYKKTFNLHFEKAMNRPLWL